MSSADATDDEFKVVSYKRSRTRNENQIKLSTFLKSSAVEHFDLEAALRRLEAAKQDLVTSDLYSSVLASLKEGLDILHRPEVEKIVCFGLGRIGECMIARYQLALLLCLRDLYKAKTVVYDPAFADNDRKILNTLNIDILHNNVEGKFKVGENTTLFYLPHCPKQLTNNLLWANWGLELSKCVIIANSFTKILESNSKRHVTENASYILSVSSYVTELAVINSFKYYDIFNDTAIHIFPWNNISLVPSDFWQYHDEPRYLDDIEFISNTFSEEIKIKKMNYTPSIKILRQIISELRHINTKETLKDSLVLRYILDQYRKFKTTDQQVCKAREEVNFVANTYLCYLRSSRIQEEIHSQYHGKGERSIRETANIVGFKLPHDPK